MSLILLAHLFVVQHYMQPSFEKEAKPRFDLTLLVSVFVSVLLSINLTLLLFVLLSVLLPVLLSIDLTLLVSVLYRHNCCGQLRYTHR